MYCAVTGPLHTPLALCMCGKARLSSPTPQQQAMAARTTGIKVGLSPAPRSPPLPHHHTSTPSTPASHVTTASSTSASHHTPATTLVPQRCSTSHRGTTSTRDTRQLCLYAVDTHPALCRIATNQQEQALAGTASRRFTLTDTPPLQLVTMTVVHTRLIGSQLRLSPLQERLLPFHPRGSLTPLTASLAQFPTLGLCMKILQTLGEGRNLNMLLKAMRAMEWIWVKPSVSTANTAPLLPLRFLGDLNQLTRDKSNGMIIICDSYNGNLNE